MVECSKCKLLKSKENFVKDRHRANGLFAWCKECTRRIVDERREREYIEAPAAQKCNRCHETMPLIEENFGRCKSNVHGFQYECKPCKRARRKKAYQQKAWNETPRSQIIKTNGPVDKITYSDIFERDSGICGVCHESVDPALRNRESKSGSIDHIMPLSRGGTHTFDNVQLAHLYCNYEKGIRTE